MDIAERFQIEINRCLPLLEQDEWALAKSREKIISELSAEEAFLSVVPILNLAKNQSDEYAFLTCCWLASQLAEISNTTECPNGLIASLGEAHKIGLSFGESTAKEVLKLSNWYRVGNAI